MFIRQLWSFLQVYTFYTVIFCAFCQHYLCNLFVGGFNAIRENLFRQRTMGDSVDMDVYSFLKIISLLFL